MGRASRLKAHRQSVRATFGVDAFRLMNNHALCLEDVIRKVCELEARLKTLETANRVETQETGGGGIEIAYEPEAV